MLMRLAAAIAMAVGIAPQSEPPRNVLFIGNSLTMANGLPGMVETLSSLAGGPRLRATVVATGGYSLEDHWNQGDARHALARGGWSDVVLQQGPSSQPDSRALLREYVRRFDREAQNVGARVAIYMVWPPRTGPGTFDQVRASYAQAARDVNGRLLPVGEAFRALMHDSSLVLLGPDGFHPTPLGSYVAASMIFHGLAGGEPFVPTSIASPTAAFPTITIKAPQAERLRAVIRDVTPRP